MNGHSIRRYRTRRADGLPVGQRLMKEMPRFTDRPTMPPPQMPAEPRLEITCAGAPVAVLTGAELEALAPRDHRADFHCVTGWSVTGLIWTGVPLRSVFASVGITHAPMPYLVARAGDGRRCAFVWEDAIADDVVLATHLDGHSLDDRHGGPLRLVAPSQYGYKNIKHVIGLDFRADQPALMSKEHLRARMAAEERHPVLPSWAVRLPYRLMVAPVASLSERTLRRHRATALG